MRNKELYNWYFHFNSYTDKWNAFHRDDVHGYHNGTETTYPVYSHTSFTELITILDKIDLCS